MKQINLLSSSTRQELVTKLTEVLKVIQNTYDSASDCGTEAKLNILQQYLQEDCDKSPWVNHIGLSGIMYRLVSEASEACAAAEVEPYDMDDYSKIFSELGDVFWVWMDALLLIQKGVATHVKFNPAKYDLDAATQAFSLDEFLRKVILKIEHRKPWLCDAHVEFPKTVEEEKNLVRTNKKTKG